jgi:DNA-binding NarL/FixJ family response regulator
MKRWRVLVVDDHALFADGITTLLSTHRELDVVGKAASATEGIRKAQALRPDLILMDIQMPGMSGLEATCRIKAEMPETRVVILTVSDDDENVLEALRCGAQGYLLKDMPTEDFCDVLLGLARGEAAISPALSWRVLQQLSNAKMPPPEEDLLSPREVDVLRLVAKGYTNHQIAEALPLSEHAVRLHLRAIRRKLHAQNRTQAATRGVQMGLI